MSGEEKKLKEIISKVLLLDETKIYDGISRNDVEAWDSLTHLILISEIETVFQISFSDEDVIEINTIGDLKAKMRKHGIQI
ncbi:MAG: acyl carrier protein [Nitrososphaerota archaeon]|nr:acyl carrier protein [Candidatus Bathyarchaeota archaeon]MDW8049037.1 acyl carrier protein [Nitrososphaerota archaeon]